MIVRAILNRFRFIVVFACVVLFVRYWDTVKNHWDRWTHPRAAVSRKLPDGQEFYCPMHPQVTRTTYEPNGSVPNCPICGMPLSIRAKGQPEKLPPGVTGRVWLSSERIEMAGIKTVAVRYRPVVRKIKTVGYVTYDESRVSRVVSRVAGYVEKLYVDKTFAVVHEGDPLAEIYSPELYSTAKELILAKSNGVSPDLAESARQRLLLLGVSAEEIDKIAASREPSTRLLIRSPQSGFVVEKKIVVGSAVEPAMTLLKVADLSSVWIEGEVYAKDIAFLHLGQQVEAQVEAYPRRTFRGELAAIYPQVEAATRTNRVRLRLNNPGNELRPGMFADVTINTPLETIEPYKTLAAKSERTILVKETDGKSRPQPEFLVVPRSAVIDTGERKIVYVERKPGQFDGVEVELGPREDDFYPVLKGLAAGDRVAAAGGFLIDSETRLNPAAASTYFGASGGPQSNGGAPAPDVQEPSSDKTTQALPASAPSPDEMQNIKQLPADDQRLAIAQGRCPVTQNPLGLMGVPVKIMLRGRPVFLCCKGCIGKAQGDPDGTLKKLDSLKPSP